MTEEQLEALQLRLAELEARVLQLENWQDYEVEINRSSEYYAD